MLKLYIIGSVTLLVTDKVLTDTLNKHSDVRTTITEFEFDLAMWLILCVE